MSLAELWEHWDGPDGRVIESCSILTTSANDLMAPIHDRMPVILPGRDDVGIWLDVGSSQEEISGLLLPCNHETWSVLTHIFPKADIPVVQLSIDSRQPPMFHYELGKRLMSLRDEGILIIGSGNLVHNLYSYV